MKVLLLNDYATPTAGAEIMLLSLRDGLHRHGHEVRVFASDAELLPGDSFADAVCRVSTTRLQALTSTHNRSARRELIAEVNVDGTRNVARVVASEGIQRLVLASSVGVYGLITRGPITESTPVRPNSHYRVSKAAAERLLFLDHQRSGLPVVIARLSSIVGNGAGSWLPFFRSAGRNDFRMIGEGQNRIQIGQVPDAADCLMRCTLAPGIEGETFNVSGGEPIPVREYVEVVRTAFGATDDIGRLPSAPFLGWTRLADLTFRYGSIELPRYKHYELFLADMAFDPAKCRERLNFEPSVSTAECAARLARHYIEENLL